MLQDQKCFVFVNSIHVSDPDSQRPFQKRLRLSGQRKSMFFTRVVNFIFTEIQVPPSTCIDCNDYTNWERNSLNKIRGIRLSSGLFSHNLNTEILLESAQPDLDDAPQFSTMRCKRRARVKAVLRVQTISYAILVTMILTRLRPFWIL